MRAAFVALGLIACAALGYFALSWRSTHKVGSWPPAEPPNLLANGSFESGLDGWTGDGYRVVSAGIEAFHGSQVLEIDPGDDPERLTTGVLSAELELEPFNAYRIRLHVQSGFDSPWPRVGLSLNGRSVYDAVAGMPTGPYSGGVTPRRGSWVPQSYVFFADRRENTLILGPLSRYSKQVIWGKCWLDHVRIEEVGWTRTLGQDFDLHATLPSQALVDEELELDLHSIGHRRADEKINIAGDHYFELPVRTSGTFALSVEGGRATFPPVLTLENEASRRIPIRFHTPGVQRVVLQGAGYVARSNPIRVGVQRVERQAYWGDIHVHTRYGHADWYGGEGEEIYRFARDVARLDFAALSEHYTNEIRADWVERLAPAALRCNEPGRFVTLLGVETGGPAGHWNYYLRGDDPLQMFEPSYFSSHPCAASAELRRYGASYLSIPHHFMLLDPVDWRFTDREAQTVAEIYSVHGLSEVAGEWWRHPLHSGLYYSDSMGARGHDYRTALARGHRLGVIACSDDHTARPGLAGLTCVLAPALERGSVWDSLQQRRCYATSGARVLLDFEIESSPQGSEIVVAPGEPLSARIEAHGTNPIERVELLRDGDVWQAFAGRGLDFEERVELGPFAGRPTYYQVRLFQDDLHRAWSSPIWIDPAGVPDLALEHKDFDYDFETSTLLVTPRNYGAAPARARLTVHSSAKDPRLAELEIARLERVTFALRLEPIDDERVRIKALLFIPKEVRRAFSFSGRIDVHAAQGFELAADPRGMLVVEENSIRWQDEFGYHFRLVQSKSGQLSDFEIIVRAGPETWIEVAPLVDDAPPDLLLGVDPLPGPTVRLDDLYGLASRTLVAERALELVPGQAPSLSFPRSPSERTYVVVLDPEDTVEETFENNNAWAFVPRKTTRRPHWPEYLAKETEK